MPSIFHHVILSPHPKLAGTKFFVVVNDHGTTVQYSVVKDGEFSCSFAGAVFTKLVDAVVAIVSKSQKIPFKTTVEGGKGLKLTTAAVKKRKASASQLALFDDDGGLEIPRQEHLSTNPNTKELFRSTDAPVPEDEDAEVFDEPTHDDLSNRPPSPPENSFDVPPTSTHNTSDTPFSPPQTSLDPPTITTATTATGNLFDDPKSDNDDIFETPGSTPAVSATQSSAPVAKNKEKMEEEEGDAADTELASLIRDVEIDSNLDALILGIGEKKTSLGESEKKQAESYKNHGLFDADDSDEDGDGSAENLNVDGMGAAEIDAYLKANT